MVGTAFDMEVKSGKLHIEQQPYCKKVVVPDPSAILEMQPKEIERIMS